MRHQHREQGTGLLVVVGARRLDESDTARQGAAVTGTDLLRDETMPGRYVTLDRWRSVAAYRAFREQSAAEYAALDLECETLTRAEKALGSFTEVAP